MTAERSCLAIVLAAGEGTRMRSALPKVLHSLASRSLLAHALDAVRKAGFILASPTRALTIQPTRLSCRVSCPLI